MPKKREHFSQSNLTAAVEAVVNEGMSKKSAAKKFSVSMSTLQHRLKNPDQKCHVDQLQYYLRKMKNH